jgi:glycosyltransferase involved in cell wall biosynthesis
MNYLISIIIPIYNTEKYILKCLNSVISQTYNNWEIILINDGSTDNTYELCKRYFLSDSRIYMINKNNTGVSDSRNRALDIAKGKYVIFLDSDDYWCDISILEKMIRLAEKYNLDIVRAGYKEVGEFDEILFVPDNSRKISNKVVDSITFLEKILCGEYFLCLCLIKKERIGNIRFNIKRKYLEDVEFYLNILMNDLRCMFLPEIFYAYRKQSNSVTMNFNPSLWGDILDIVRLCFNLSDKSADYKRKFYLLNEGLSFFFSNTSYISRYPLSIKEILLTLKDNGIDDLYRDVKNRLKNSCTSNKYKEKCLTYEHLLIYYRYKYLFKRCIRKILKI